ncbi:MAG: hypothetical protein ACYTG0_45150, partial [Planctomycetota bacterium]
MKLKSRGWEGDRANPPKRSASRFARIGTVVVSLFLTAMPHPVRAEEEPAVVVAEGEQFHVRDDRGWSVRHQEQSYATQAFGGMWVTHGGLLGAPAESVDSVAVEHVEIPRAEEATLSGNNRLKWYSRLFGAEERFAHYRRLTDVARRAFGPQVLTGANYSPH